MSTKDRPILFSGPMVRAILDGTKTQTRRAVKPQPQGNDLQICTSAYDWQTCEDGYLHGLVAGDHGYDALSFCCPYGIPGERLWVRETWAHWSDGLGPVDESSHILYRADTARPDPKRWRPSIFMHRADSRILLEITDVRVQRLQEISEEDARAEGVSGPFDDLFTPRLRFERLWEAINGADSWEANPWVWAVTFQRLQP